MEKAAATTKLIFKGEIPIRQIGLGGEKYYEIGALGLIPLEVFLPSDNPSELELRDPWFLESGERSIPEHEGFQRRISSPKTTLHYFIPSSYLYKVVE
jgi:hypothetical protein